MGNKINIYETKEKTSIKIDDIELERVSRYSISSDNSITTVMIELKLPKEAVTFQAVY